MLELGSCDPSSCDPSSRRRCAQSYRRRVRRAAAVRITFALWLKTTAAQQAGGWRTVLGDGTGLNAVVALSLKGPWVVV